MKPLCCHLARKMHAAFKASLWNTIKHQLKILVGNSYASELVSSILGFGQRADFCIAYRLLVREDDPAASIGKLEARTLASNQLQADKHVTEPHMKGGMAVWRAEFASLRQGCRKHRNGKARTAPCDRRTWHKHSARNHNQHVLCCCDSHDAV